MNTQITISNIEENIVERLKLEASQNGKDLNTYLIYLLKSSVGLEQIDSECVVYNDLDFLAGNWTEEEYQTFISTTSQFRKIDDQLWE